MISLLKPLKLTVPVVSPGRTMFGHWIEQNPQTAADAHRQV
jgi:hypothetical protein